MSISRQTYIDEHTSSIILKIENQTFESRVFECPKCTFDSVHPTDQPLRYLYLETVTGF